MAAVRTELVAALHRDLQSASGSGRAVLVEAAANAWGVTPNRVRAIVRQHRRQPGESARKGDRKVTETEAREIAKVMVQSRDRRGRVRLGVEAAVEVAIATGVIRADFDADTSTVRRRLRELNLNRDSLERPEAATKRISLHSNHVHLVDFSVCAQWYFGDDRKVFQTEAGRTKRLLQQLREHRELRYKPEHFQGRRHLWRFLLVDHLSGVMFARYYYSPGERAEDLADFLHAAWSRGSNRAFPFHGCPKMIAADQGAPFRSKAIQTLLKFHDVALELHAPGNAKASGAVERAHRTWEDAFESRLRLAPAAGLEELNDAAEKFAARYCALRPHRRHGMTRTAAWCKWITPELLRLPPTQEQFLRLATRDPITRETDSHLRISIGRQELGDAAGQFELAGRVQVRETVTVVVAPWADQVVRVWNVHGEELTVKRLERGDGGFWRGGTEAVFGSGQVRQHPHTAASALAAKVEAEPATLPMSAAFGSELAPVEIDFIAPRGGQPAVPHLGPLGSAPPVTALEALQAARARKGSALTPAESQAARDAVSGGLRADRLDAFLDSLFTVAATGSGA